LRSLLIGLSAFVVLRLLAWFFERKGFGTEPDAGVFAGLALTAVVLIVVALALQIRQMLFELGEAVRTSNRRFRDLLSDIDAIVWEADPATFQFRFVSERAPEILGYPVRQWLDEPDFWVRHLHPDDREWVPAACREAVETGGDHRLEYRMIAADGRTVWIRHNARMAPGGKAASQLRGLMVDITGIKQAQHALQKSEATNRALLDAVPDLMLRVRRDGTLLAYKPSRDLPFGQGRELVAGYNLRDVLPPDVAAEKAALIERALETGEPQVQEFLLPVGDSMRDIEDRIVASGEDEVLVLVRDITARKRAEEALRAAEAELRRVLSSVSDCIWTAEVDSGGAARYLYTSPVIERISGRPPEYFADPAHWCGQAHSEDRERLQKFLHEVAVGEARSAQIEYRVLWPDGSVRWVRSTATASRIDDRRVRLDGIDADITAHKEADEALRQASEALGAVIQASPLAIFALDLEACVKSWNPAAESIFGWTAEEVIGRHMPMLLDQDPEVFRSRIERGKRGEMMNGLEVTQRRKDGSSVELAMWTALLRDEAGEPSGFMTVAADITQRKYLEEQLRQSQKMEAIGRLAGGVAHDFNNLLTVITGYGYMLLDDLDTLDSAGPLRVNVDEILRAVERASALTNQLLAFSRRQIARPKPIDLTVLVANMDRMLRRVIGEHIELAAELSSEVWAVRADPGQIEQVLMNLIVNARDAMPAGGRITVRTENVRVDREFSRVHGAKPGRYVKLSVTDTGHGMDDETKARLFEPFFTTKEKGKGTGLGMSLVYGIIKQSGGAIEVSSEPGKGTVIAIYLPGTGAAVPGAPEVPEAPETERGSETVLLAEDEDYVRRLVVDLLTQRGYTVIEASHPAAAVQLCEQYPREIHLLLTDVVMPGMNGRELAERLAWMRPNMKVVYMSGYTDDARIVRGLETLLLKKPFTPSALARKIRQALDHSAETEPTPETTG
jgi:two-component system cell cycle sensor histidine kinase/response regulator CckA